MGELLLVDGPHHGVATLTLNRPDKRNALSTALRDEISEALDALADDDQLRCLVITGAGAVFSAGFDLKEFQVDDAEFQRALWASSDRYHRTVLEFPLPTVAAVNGPALAGGFDLAVLCDLRIASSAARFAHPEIGFGDVVYGPLHDLVGASVARDLAFTGRAIDAEEAHRLHVVSEVCQPDELMTLVGERAAQIAAAPRDVLLRMKAKVLRRNGISPGATLDL